MLATILMIFCLGKHYYSVFNKLNSAHFFVAGDYIVPIVLAAPCIHMLCSFFDHEFNAQIRASFIFFE